MPTPFPCKQCGKCCSTLEKEEWTGISLFPWETHLFPKEATRPSLGLGENPDHPDFKLILHTYSAPNCKHLDDNRCTIHPHRPLVCRSYPFRATRQGNKNIYVVAPECTVIEDWPDTRTIWKRYDEMDAADLILDHLSRFYKATEPKWRYIPEKDWTRIGTVKKHG